jgi:hypothetical protein
MNFISAHAAGCEGEMKFISLFAATAPTVTAAGRPAQRARFPPVAFRRTFY